MPKNDIFFDSSALIAGIVSAQGAVRALLLLAEDEKILISVSEQVIAEVERNIARKAPKAVPFARELILRANIRILRDPQLTEILEHQD
jgi:predicted nucleic acid-binding protein